MGLVTDCPLSDLVNDLARRVAVLDGNGYDPTGGTVGRLTAVVHNQAEFQKRIQFFAWVLLGMMLGSGIGSFVWLRKIYELMPK